VEFSADGRFVLTSSDDGTARLWHARMDDLLRVADERIGRDFTREERRQFADLLGPENRRVLETWDLVDRLHGELYMAADVLERIRSDAALDEDLRAHALRLAGELRDDDALLARRAWAAVRFPGGDARRALRWAGRAAEIAPGSGRALRALGAAQYRSGSFEEALKALGRAREANGPGVEDLAFLALAAKALGRDDEARSHLDEARQLAPKPTAEQRRLLQEASKALGPR
jgi:tetratricopeptide (TPR) repeat protein